MCIICGDDNPAYLLLDRIRRMEQMLLGLYNREDLVKIAHDAAQVNRANYLRLLRNCICQLIIIHLHAVLLRIHKDQLASHVLSNRSRGRICISWHNDFIFRSHADQAQRHLHGRRRGVQAHSFPGSKIRSYLPFKLLRLRARSNPSTQDSFRC